MTKVIILCGGMGTRLREETEYHPKPMVTVGSKPILWHIMKGYAHHGFKDFVLALGYKAEVIKDYFLNYECMNADFTIRLGRRDGVTFHDSHTEEDFSVTLADTGLHTMTGGRVKRLARYVGDEDFLVTYGDGVSDVDIRAVYDFHKRHGKLATLTSVRMPSRFGVVEAGEDGAVRRFHEKPQGDGWINAGFFVFSPKVFDYLGGDDCVLETAPLGRLAAEGQLMAYRHPGFFFAMDTYREYKLLNSMWDDDKAPWKVW